MFDLFIDYCFTPEQPREIDFSRLSRYKDIKGKTGSFRTPSLSVSWLERESTLKKMHHSGNLTFMVFGSVFTNQKYALQTGIKPHAAGADFIENLYLNYHHRFIKWIKGSFIIIIINHHDSSIQMFTDQLNVLPLYYFHPAERVVITSNTALFAELGICDIKPNMTALAEQAIFDYPLSDSHFISGIKQTLPASHYTFSKGQTQIQPYWDVSELISQELLPRRQSLDLLAEQLFENVALYTSDTEKLLVSLTGGFDGRTNLAMLRKPAGDFLCYSYGMPGSLQIEIPQQISKKLGIPYKPVYLDQTFEQQYGTLAGKAIYFSNGMAPLMRANYPYAYQQLNSFADTILTGLFGSEILRPIFSMGIFYNDDTIDIFLSGNPESALKNTIRKIKSFQLIDDDILDQAEPAILEKLKKNYFDKYKDIDPVMRFFLFIINEGLRKYFMQEIQIERVYVTTRFPYFDIDFVELIHKTPYAGMYNGFLGNSKIKRRKGQLLYAHIFKRYNPELGKITLDRGYTPDTLLQPFPANYINIYRGVLKMKQYYKQKGNETFNSEVWSIPFITNVLKNYEPKKTWGTGIKSLFENKQHRQIFLKYAHILSVYQYFNMIAKK